MNRADAFAPEQFPLTGMRLIEASAGTGKTYNIANLYLRLVVGLDEDLDPQGWGGPPGGRENPRGDLHAGRRR